MFREDVYAYVYIWTMTSYPGSRTIHQTCDSKLFGFKATLRVFRGFNGLSSISGSEVMAKLPEIN